MKTLVPAALLVSLLSAAGSHAQPQSQGQAQVPSAVQPQIKVGVAGPLSGESKPFGVQFKNGASQAIEDINTAGGILGQQIVVEYGDDAAEVERGKAVAAQFIQDKVGFVLGHFNSDVTLEASVMYQQNNVLEVTPSSTNVQITERGMWNIFRTCGRDDQQAEVAVRYAYQHFRGKTIGIVNNKTAFGAGLAEQVRDGLHRFGMTEALYETIDVGQKDFTNLVLKLKNGHVDVVYVAAEHTEGALLIKQIREAGLDTIMMGSDGFSTSEFGSIAGLAGRSTLMTFQRDERDRPEAQEVIESFRAKGIEPEAYTLYSYAAMQVIKQSIEAVGTFDTRRVAARIASGVAFGTVVGDLTFPKRGDITRFDYVMYIWEPDAGGKLVYRQLTDTRPPGN